MRQIVFSNKGKVRAVYSPERRESRKLREIGYTIAAYERRLAAQLGVVHVAHGFVPGRSQVTCALPHVGEWAVTIGLDLAGWFDSVRFDQVREALAEAGASEATAIAETVCVRGAPPSPRPDELAPRQGLPSSPAAANIAAVRMDADIVRRLNSAGIHHVYTRYADDLNISVATPDSVVTVIENVRAAVLAMGWAIAEHKTAVQYARSGRRVVVGVSVGPDGIRARRQARRKLRAAMHQNPQSPSARGLAGWCSCPLPKAARPRRVVLVSGYSSSVNALGSATRPEPNVARGHEHSPSLPPRLSSGAARRRIILGEGQ